MKTSSQKAHALKPEEANCPRQIRVMGAGTEAVNGVYDYDGSHLKDGGVLKYTKSAVYEDKKELIGIVEHAEDHTWYMSVMARNGKVEGYTVYKTSLSALTWEMCEDDDVYGTYPPPKFVPFDDSDHGTAEQASNTKDDTIVKLKQELKAKDDIIMAKDHTITKLEQESKTKDAMIDKFISAILFKNADDDAVEASKNPKVLDQNGKECWLSYCLCQLYVLLLTFFIMYLWQVVALLFSMLTACSS